MNYGPFDTLMFCVLAQNNLKLSGLNEFLLRLFNCGFKIKPGFIHFRRRCGKKDFRLTSEKLRTVVLSTTISRVIVW